MVPKTRFTSKAWEVVNSFLSIIKQKRKEMSFFQSLVITAAWLNQLGEHRSSEREVVGSNPGRTNNQVRWCWLWFETLSQLKCSRHWAVTFSYCPCLLHPSFISKIKGYVKELTLLFAKCRVRFPGGVVYLSRITFYSYHGLWVGYSKFINGLTAAATRALVCWRTSLLLVC